VASQPSIVARRIAEIRASKKLSRQDLADRVGTTYLQIYRYETGKTEIPADLVPLLADALDASVASLFREAKAS
jgi:transcriptional regulator with XRE-family HTH domain